MILASLTAANLAGRAIKLLPTLTRPALRGLADRLQVAASASGLALERNQQAETVRLIDTSPDAFSREFGTLDTLPDPALSNAVATARTGQLADPISTPPSEGEPT